MYPHTSSETEDKQVFFVCFSLYITNYYFLTDMLDVVCLSKINFLKIMFALAGCVLAT